jgi:hypothetical protein
MVENDSIIQSLIDSGMMNAPVAEPIIETPPITNEPVKEAPIVEPIVETPIETPTPVIDTPPITNTPAEITNEQRLTFINETLGTNYKSLEEVNSLKEDLTALPTLKEQASVPKAKFHNEAIAELNSFMAATGIEEASILKDIKRYTNTEQKDPIEAMVLSQIIANPSLVDRKDTLRDILSEKYNLTIDEDEDPASEARRIDRVKLMMEMDAQSANQTIQATMGKIAEYKSVEEPDNTQSIQEAKATNLSAWKEVLADNKFHEQFNSIEVEVPLGKYDDETDLGTETVKFELTAEQKKAAINNVKALSEQGVPCTEQNVRAAIEFELLKAKSENMQAVLQKGIKQFLSKQKETLEAKYHNTSARKIETPISTPKEGEFKDLAEWTMAHINQAL